MARIRTIKPEFWTDEKIVDLDLADRLLFIGLWNFADDQGFIDYSPRRIKMQIFPGDNIDVSVGLARLLEASLIEAFDGPKGVVLWISNWNKHQRVSNPARERFVRSDLRKRSNLEGPSIVLVSPLEPSRVLGKGREVEGKGRDSSAGVASPHEEPSPTLPRNRGTRIPEPWIIDDAMWAWAAQEGFPTEMVDAQTKRFVNYWLAKPGRDGVKLDWKATWKNWLLKAGEDLQRSFRSGRQQETDALFDAAMQRAITRDQQELMP